ncbi:GlxA family transcriptional regulator [Sphingobium sp.]|uniref:GlxA family transcriptional regulator n=1 Tax=Sphingobium sp. TaxID=1912891 RepID=UPI0028BE5AC8|nr:helix-turn-helix domain-containing protein [Sphingobium sp.]
MPHPVSTLRIAILCSPDTQLASVAPFLDLARLSRQADGQMGEQERTPVLDVELIRTGGQPSSLFEPLVSPGSDAFPIGCSAIILPAGADLSGSIPVPDERCLTWLEAEYRRGVWIGGIGTGVLMLAAAAMLNGGPASIPPRHNQLIRSLYPRITHGHVGGIVEYGRILTAGECASTFALAVMLTRRIHSHGLAERYRRECGILEAVVPDDSHLPMRQNSDLLVAEARAWIIAHMQDRIDIPSLAAHFNVSARTLSRRFHRSTGTTPAHFLRSVRMDTALSMLRRTRFSVEQIAHLVGYSDVGAFREVFHSHMGISPREYRMANLSSQP